MAGPLSGEGPGLAGDHVRLRRLSGSENRPRAQPRPAGHEVTGPSRLPGPSVALQRGTGECWHTGETGVSMGRPVRQGSQSWLCPVLVLLTLSRSGDSLSPCSCTVTLGDQGFCKRAHSASPLSLTVEPPG